MRRSPGAARLAGIAVVVLTLAMLPRHAAAQFPPDSLTNLQTLPADIPFRELMGTMRGFTFALDVRCSTCHVGEEGEPLSTYDFASDDKPLKRKAREMLEMVFAINNRHLTRLEDRREPDVAVTCYTCHRGTRVPRTIQAELQIAFGDGGVDSLVARYEALHDEYYGRGTYDFGPSPLGDVGVGLIRTDADGAVAVLRYGVERFPDDWQLHHQLGTALEATSDVQGAIAEYRRALELFPGDRIARQRLEELGG